MRSTLRAAIAFKFAPGKFVSAAPAIMLDEGTGRLFGRLWLWGGLSFGYIFFGQAKTNLTGLNLNMRSMARRANHRDVICNVTRKQRRNTMH
jgi:hypothetical protein